MEQAQAKEVAAKEQRCRNTKESSIIVKVFLLSESEYYKYIFFFKKDLFPETDNFREGNIKSTRAIILRTRSKGISKTNNQGLGIITYFSYTIYFS